MKNYEVTKEINGNNVPFGSHFKIKKDFEIQIPEETRFWIFKVFKPFEKNPENSPKLYLGKTSKNINFLLHHLYSKIWRSFTSDNWDLKEKIEFELELAPWLVL
jgi:hypothetical protein